jgi:transglutaminase superfamily protein/transglutaminase TgpA-like protein
VTSPDETAPARAGHRRLVDAGCVLTLVTLVLFGFDETFSGRAYLATGLVGAGAVVLIALAVTAARGPRTDIFLLAAAAAYVPVGAVTAFRPYEQGRLPAGAELLDVLTATLTGTEQLLTTIPPVDPVGSVMVLPYALGFLGAGAAIWLSFRTRRTLAPIVPLLLAEAVVILLGPLRSGDRTLVLGAAFAGLAFWWASWRAADPAVRHTEVTHAGRGRLTRAVAAGLVIAVAVVVVTQLVPVSSLDGDRTVLRGRIGSGATIDQFDNPLVGFRRYTEQKDGSPDNVFDKTLFVVKGLDRPTAMRFVTLDTYDGTAWRTDNRTVEDAEDDLFQRIGSEVAASRSGEEVEVNVEMRAAYTGAWLPLVGQLTGIDFDYADGRAQREDVRYNPFTGSAMVVGGLGPDDDYTFTASVPPSKLAKNARAYPVANQLMPLGQPLDVFLAPYIQTGKDPLTQVLLLARYLERNGRYSDGTGALNVPPGHDINRLVTQFIGARRIVGNDEQYAAFMALAANRLRVPARVVVGTFTKDGKVRGRDVIAWVEVRVRDGSWRILPTPSFMSHRKPKADDEPPQSLEDFVQDQLPQEDPDKPDPPEQLPQPDDSDANGDDAGSDGSGLPVQGASLGLVLLALVSQLVPGAKLVRRLVRRRRRRPSSRVVGAWRELLDLAVDLRVPVRDGDTREAQARALGAPGELARGADDLIFAVGAPGAAAAADFWREAEQARQALARRHPLWRQVLAFYNPASVVAEVRRRLAPSSRRGSRLPWPRRGRARPGIGGA